MVDTAFLDSSACECDVTLDTWLKDALPYVPGIDRDVAARELVLAAREFFDRTFAWTALIEGRDAKAGDKQYWLSPYDQYANVIGILSVSFDGVPLAPLPNKPRNAAAYTGNGTPNSYYTLNAPDSIYLWPRLEVDTADALDIHVALTPKQSVEHLPRIAALKFYDAILDGFLYRALRQANKPYSNPQLAAEYRRSFSGRCANAMAEAKGGFLQAQNWNYPGGWGVR